MKPTVERKRHILKAITWRIIASVTTFLIGWAVTGNMELGMTVGFIDVILKLALYYFHERAWYRIDFGVNRKKEE